MSDIDQSLRYLKEALSNYLEDDDHEYKQICEQLMSKLEEHDYEDEDQFLDELEEEETEYLNMLLENEIHYAYQAQDEVRLKELNEIYELLF